MDYHRLTSLFPTDNIEESLRDETAFGHVPRFPGPMMICPSLAARPALETCLVETRQAGFTGTETGKFPKDAAALSAVLGTAIWPWSPAGIPVR